MERKSVSMMMAVAFCVIATSAHAQSTFIGRVLTDSGAAIAGAEVVINKLQLTQRSNAQGEFKFTAVRAGEHIVSVRMPGFAPKVDTIEVADAGEFRREYRLARIEVTLPEVPVTTSSLDRKLVEFHERRRMGIGRFMDSTEFAKAPGTRTSDRLKRFPGLQIGRGRFLSEAYVLTTRGGTGFRRTCAAAIWLDGVKMTGFSVNQLDPSMISAVEWYAGPASVPAKFNVTSAVCGVLVIWTR